ncbi:organic cation transporter protein, partial [Elysia marginata]
LELVGPAWRTAMGMGAEFAWVAGEFLVLPLAYFLNEWRPMYLALGVASLFAILAISATSIRGELKVFLKVIGHDNDDDDSDDGDDGGDNDDGHGDDDVMMKMMMKMMMVMMIFTPESPRWLLDKGKTRKARTVIEKIAASNNKTLPKDALTSDTGEEGPSVTVWEMFQYRRLVLRTCIIFYNWFCVNLLYYGLSLNLDNLPGNPYINFLISCTVELVAYVITFFILDRVGRKRVHTAAMFVGGVACLAVIVPVAYLSSEYTWVVTALAMVGKTAAAICYATLYIMTTELFPTVVRNSGLACCSIFESTASMSAPYIADLGKLVRGRLSQALPMLVFGSCALVAGLVSTQLPETLGRELPETVEDALNYDRSTEPTEKKEKPEDRSNDLQLTKM